MNEQGKLDRVWLFLKFGRKGNDGCGVKSRIVNRKWSPMVEVSGMTLCL